MRDSEPSPPARPGRVWKRPWTDRPRWRFVVLALFLVAIVGGVDFLTGHEILFSSFYLGAVALAAWTTGGLFAVAVAVLSVGSWLIGDIAAGAVYSNAFVPVWNAGITLAFYLVVIWLLVRLRSMQRDLEGRVRLRTRALTEEIAERERLEREVLDVAESERRRIGRDLHDSLGQLLTGTALAGQVLQEKLTSRSLEEARDAERLVNLVEEAIELTRNLSRGLDPTGLESGGLTQGLRELAAKTNQLSPTRCVYRLSAPVEVSDSIIATHLYRIAQEAVSNAIKHAQAQRIDLLLEGGPAWVRLTVNDDGRGLPAAARGDGMGVRIMAHRASMMRGSFGIHARPSGGTSVVCEVPLS